MSINDYLLDEFGSIYYSYLFSPQKIGDFLKEKDFITRKDSAIDQIKETMVYHEKEDLYQNLVNLYKVESSIRELQPWVRDHVVHAFLSFLLGTVINKNLLGNKIDPFQWKLAGLFHDIGYPLEISDRIVNIVVSEMDGIRGRLANQNRPAIVIPLNFSVLTKLSNGVDALDLIQQRLIDWDLRIDVAAIFNKMNEEGRVCHGVVSSLMLISIVDMFYQHFNPKRLKKKIAPINADWNQRLFEKDVVNSCAAIFLHNLPAIYFTESKLSMTKSPLAYLLKISDVLQDWERPNADQPDGNNATDYSISFNKKNVEFHCPATRLEKLQNDLIPYIETNNVTFCPI